MNLPQPLNEAFVEQITHELANSLLYEKMASYFSSMGLDNLASFFRNKSGEESGHAQKFIDHVNDRIGGVVSFQDIPAPKVDISSVKESGKIFVAAEQKTTENIESLYEMSMELGSYLDLPFLSGMLSEQVEEEAQARTFQLNIESVSDYVLFDKMFE